MSVNTFLLDRSWSDAGSPKTTFLLGEQRYATDLLMPRENSLKAFCKIVTNITTGLRQHGQTIDDAHFCGGGDHRKSDAGLRNGNFTASVLLRGAVLSTFSSLIILDGVDPRWLEHGMRKWRTVAKFFARLLLL